MKTKTIIIKINIPWDEYEKAKKHCGGFKSLKNALIDEAERLAESYAILQDEDESDEPPVFDDRIFSF